MAPRATRNSAAASAADAESSSSGTLPLPRTNANAIPVTARITENSRLYNEAFYKAHRDTKAFDSCTTLLGQENYTDWYRDFTILLRKVGYLDLFQGREIVPEYPVNLTTLEHNEYMLEHASWIGRNSSLLGYMMGTLCTNLQLKIELTKLVKDAVKIINFQCTSAGIPLLLKAKRK
ncbi:unnamed protein product [Zymoseptoria tritici ST99CH_1A5]|uniref:Retrotransposon Copia-like N-terminal domain-containing protein n=1 Tax=Zymoseptoria tritici ST99CH_1A5 TaxID=1276529 RepID=A0A1Y6LGE3_ZYMTR|nr:unnamed protein product [Zymoseptoria tritici ST99CH_1A5]